VSVLLDSCVILWLGPNPELLSEAAAEAINESTDVCVSPVSLYELGWKQRLGKVDLPQPAVQWYTQLVKRRRLSELPVTSKIAGRAIELPMIHRDPFDRILIATALENGLRLITPDPEIKKYPGVRVVW
jgi:PIN domain nuclease of toxin-antitoxin system